MENLPLQSQYLPLGATRIREIKSITAKIENCEHGGRAFQKLPRHMQRRAVSANPRRLPRYLRERHMREGGGSTKPSHRPRRKYRRRPANLLQEYNRRQKKYVWLETHVWHAKRFHMHRQWGYALPRTPTCRGYRASLRAATTGCLLQDVSYLCCIELVGVKSTILQGLSRALQPESLATLTSPEVLAGRHWLSSVFFQPERHPYGALAEVDILFHPPQHSDGEERVKLWLWTHPSAHTHIVEALTEVLHLHKVLASNEGVPESSGKAAGDQEEPGGRELKDKSEAEECRKEIHVDERKSESVPGKEEVTQHTKMEAEECRKELSVGDVSEGKDEAVPGEEDQGETKACEKETPETKTPDPEENIHLTQSTKRDQRRKKSKKSKNVNVEKLETRNVPFERTPKYISGDGSTSMTLLKDTLNRFRLLGPRAYSVLSSTAVPANVAVEEEEEVEGTVECVEVKEAWWRHYYREEGRLQSHQKQVAAWKQLASCSHPPGKVVLPLTVRDPRVMLPTKKVPIVDEDSDRVKPASPEEWPVESAMYSSDLRDQITLSKESDAALNQRRSQFLVPGSQLPETPQEARLPLLLLSRPPTSAGLGSGWDVVTPAGWGMSVFLPLVFSGGVVNGQHEAENLHLEALTSLPPHLLPDTPAGDLHCTWLAAERHREFFKRPPASRHNYIKLGVQFPFTQPWRKLLQEWQPGILDFFVLREERLLQCLSQLIHNVRKTSSKKGEKGEAAGGTSTSSTDSKTSKTGKGFTYSSSNGNAATTTDTKPEKRKAEDVMSCKETKKIKLEQSQENTQICAAEESVSGETAGMQELTVASPVSLVMVQLVLAHKGTMEPCAMVCLPQDKDFFPDDGLLRLREQGEALKEPLHEDLNHDRRAKMREEHSKIQGRLRRVRRRARQSVAKEMDFVTAAHSTQTLKDATTEALRKVDKENEAILKKHSSYKEEMESAWLMGANDPLQCCARAIMGYITHGTFSYTHGKAAGIGWVALKPLLRLVEQCREGRGQSSLLEAPSRGKCTKSLPVLVRNPSTVQYRWAHLSLVENPPPGSATG